MKININFDFNDEDFWNIFGLMERDEPVDSNALQYMVFKMAKSLVDAGRNSFTNEEQYQYNEWKNKALYGSDEYLIESLKNEIQKFLKYYVKRYEVEQTNADDIYFPIEQYDTALKWIYTIMDNEKYNKISKCFGFVKKNLESIPQKKWIVSENFDESHILSYGSTFNETSFDIPTKRGDILIGINDINDEITNIFNKIKDGTYIAIENQTFRQMNSNNPIPFFYA